MVEWMISVGLVTECGCLGCWSTINRLRCVDYVLTLRSFHKHITPALKLSSYLQNLAMSGILRMLGKSWKMSGKTASEEIIVAILWLHQDVVAFWC